MIKPVFQATALFLVASVLASCSLAQMPTRMLQAMGRTLKMADAERSSPAAMQIQIQQREIEENRMPAVINPVPAPADAKMESRVADGAAVENTVGNPS
ncbi:MAG TPA: hypothetical protein VK956_08685 [Verrucomicrobium sp.]|nr:hypothetical protein [Verrucomicrobium sp.]